MPSKTDASNPLPGAEALAGGPRRAIRALFTSASLPLGSGSKTARWAKNAPATNTRLPAPPRAATNWTVNAKMKYRDQEIMMLIPVR
jgi:hypothetical protein